MINAKKILKTIFVILLIIIMGELFFFFIYISNQHYLSLVKKSNTQEPKKISGNQNTTACDVPDYNIVEGVGSKINCCISSYLTEMTDKIFVSKTTESLILSKKGITKKLTLKAIYEGRVTKIGKETIKDINNNDLPPFFKIEIINPKTGEKDYPIVYDLEGLKKIKIYIKESKDKEIEIHTPEDIEKYIHLEDFIRVEMIMELENRLPTSYTIYKI
jgi:hypothetical protein